MRAEISALFPLQWVNGLPIEEAHIGSGVYLQSLEPSWLDEVRDQCPKVAAREQVESLGSYTHRFFYEVEAQESGFDIFNLPTHDEKQLILRAIILSRIVKPTSIAYDSVWVKSFHHADRMIHRSEPILSGINLAFVIPTDEDWNTITEADAAVMAELWDAFQFFFDNELKYRRLVRAIWFNEMAHSIWLAEMSHPVVHSALESMICAGSRNNRDQVTQRLPRLVPFINTQQAEDIYLTCCGLKHGAEALLQQTPARSSAYSPSDQRRVDAVKLLRRAVRYLLTRALRDRTFADILADKNLLKQAYPVYNRQGKLV